MRASAAVVVAAYEQAAAVACEAVAVAVAGWRRRWGTAIGHRAEARHLLLGHLGNGVGLYRFGYYGSDRAYVGVMAQEVQAVMPNAVVRGRDGYLRVYYDKLGIKFQTYEQWIASGGRMPAAFPISH